MRPKSIVLILIALGCGLVASIGISQVMDNKDQGGAKGETTMVYVAKVDIPVGEPLTAEMIEHAEWPKARVPQGVVADVKKILSNRPAVRIFKGMPILEANLISGKAADASNQIPKGYRAFTITVDKESSFANMVKPGDRVDVNAFFNNDVQIYGRGKFRLTMAKTILHDVRVFAADHRFQRNADDPEKVEKTTTITLQVTPEQAEKLAFVDQIAKIRLILRRADDDTKVAESKGVTLSKVLGSEAESAREDLFGKGPDPLSAAPQGQGGDATPSITNPLLSMLKKRSAQAAGSAAPAQGRAAQTVGGASHHPDGSATFQHRQRKRPK